MYPDKYRYGHLLPIGDFIAAWFIQKQWEFGKQQL